MAAIKPSLQIEVVVMGKKRLGNQKNRGGGPRLVAAGLYAGVAA